MFSPSEHARVQRAIFGDVPGKDHVGPIAEHQVVADLDAARAPGRRSPADAGRVEHHAAGDDALHAGREDAAGNERELVGLAAGDDGVAGVGAALIADDDVVLAGQQVDDLALGLVAPLQTDHASTRHVTISHTIPVRKIHAKAHPLQGVGFGKRFIVAQGAGQQNGPFSPRFRADPLPKASRTGNHFFMSDLLPYLLAMLLVGATVVGWVLTLVGLPGNWLMVLAAAGYAWLGPEVGVMEISWKTVLATVALAAGGEVAEFVAGMWGTRRAGGSRRAALFAMAGSLLGAIGGGTLGLPIPVVGPPIAAVLGGAVGALVGASWAEHSRGERMQKSWLVGQAAFWGRLLGTGVKTAAATAIALVIVVALVA